MQSNTTASQADSSTHKKDVYEIVTENIIKQLEKGTVPWKKPWSEGGLPQNLVSRRHYRGINILLLGLLGYEHNLFLTYKQLRDLGGEAKQGEKPHFAVYWNYADSKEKEPEAEGEEIVETSGKRKRAVLRYYSVLNIAQCSGIPDKWLPKEREERTIPSCEDIVRDMPHCPRIQFKQQKAYYNPLEDFVNMPKHKSFESDEAYYATLFHELMHSTGHHSRLNRKELLQMSEFGSDTYSLEELVAEIGTCYLLSFAGIQGQFQQSTGYIQGWLNKLRNDKRFILSAASQAQKAVDYILNIKADIDEKEE